MFQYTMITIYSLELDHIKEIYNWLSMEDIFSRLHYSDNQTEDLHIEDKYHEQKNGDKYADQKNHGL